jgi:tetratricopeptide (TPR) repeat protein
MSDTKSRAEEKNFRIVLSRFIARYRILFLSIIVLILVTLIGIGIYSTLNQKRIETSAAAVEDLQVLYDEWQAAGDNEKGDLREEIEGSAEKLLIAYKNGFAVQRTHMILGQLYRESEDWEISIDQYMKVADGFSKSYLAPIALMSAATVYEEMENYESAIAAYERVSKEYSSSFPLTAYALISSGRLYEKTGDTESAIESYNNVIDNFSGSSWTNIAQDRIIYLETVN